MQRTAENPDALVGTSFFQYGRTTAYGAATPVKPLAARTTAPERAVLSKLAPGTYHYRRGLKPHHTYHYRLVAISSSGRTVGPDETFTTREVNKHGTP